ncbi:MAG TPA: YkvA family protein [Clostridia bacterium]|nr:YkvA family protein [Clostridia bacterium]
MGNNEERDIFSVIGKLPRYSKLLIKLYKSDGIRRRHKVLLSMGIAYSLSPIELIPGIIPVAGQLDNLLVMLHCLEKVIEASDRQITGKYLEESGISLDEIKEDIKLTGDTLQSIGKGTVKVISNTVKFAGYSVLYGIRKLRRKDPF